MMMPRSTRQKSGRIDIGTFVRTREALRLSNLGQMELLRAVTQKDRVLRTRVRGFSMTPLIRDGDEVSVSPMKGRLPVVGDVIAFSRPDSGQLTIHRVIARESAGWILRGDNCPESDGLVTADRFIGRITAVYRNRAPRRFGLGAEGRLIAWLVRRGWLPLLTDTSRLPRRIVLSLVGQLQETGLYRIVAARLIRDITIDEATGPAGEFADPSFLPDKPDLPGKPESKITTFIARRGEAFAGRVRLVRYPESDRPMRGHWLFSLTVRTRYRGLGVETALIRRVLQRSISDGASQLRLMVYPPDRRVLRLVRGLGFEKDSQPALEPVLDEEARRFGRRRIVMRKPLKADRSAVEQDERS
jgi:GNAT superfamily N-acetyltransferase